MPNLLKSPIHLGESDERFSANWIKSIYGRENVDAWLEDQVASGRLLYVNTKKAEASGVTGWHDLLPSNVEAPVRCQKPPTFYSNRKGGSKLEIGHGAVLWISPIQTLDSASLDSNIDGNEPNVKVSWLLRNQQQMLCSTFLTPR